MTLRHHLPSASRSLLQLLAHDTRRRLRRLGPAGPAQRRRRLQSELAELEALLGDKSAASMATAPISAADQ